MVVWRTQPLLTTTKPRVLPEESQLFIPLTTSLLLHPLAGTYEGERQNQKAIARLVCKQLEEKYATFSPGCRSPQVVNYQKKVVPAV